MSAPKPAILALEDGSVFRGAAFGADATIAGECVFNTSMTGYQEIITDPSYFGQIVTMTAPQIGNYGINAEDDEHTAPKCSGLVVREVSPIVSNWRSQLSLDAYLRKYGIPGISEVDTRALTKKLTVRVLKEEVAEERATAARFRALFQTLRFHMPDAQVFRVGTVQVHTYLVGRTRCGDVAGLKTLLVSGGFTYFSERVRHRLGLDFARANTLGIANGRLTGTLFDRPWGDIVDGAEKKRVLLASLDTQRPAAQTQLDVLARQVEVTGLPIVAGEGRPDRGPKFLSDFLGAQGADGLLNPRSLGHVVAVGVSHRPSPARIARAAEAFLQRHDGLEIGARVEVEGAIVNGVLVATKVEMEDRRDRGRRALEFRGEMSNLDTTAKTFRTWIATSTASGPRPPRSSPAIPMPPARSSSACSTSTRPHPAPRW